jgi:hypothetical protein
MSAPTIIEAMDSPALFGRYFAGPSWDNWRAVLRGAFALQMTEAELAFFRSVTGREPSAKRVREVDVVAGRRSGKDSVTSFIAAYAAATFRPNGRTRPGERPVVLLLGADRGQARSLLGYIKGYFSEIPALAALVERETLDGLELSTGVDIIVATSDFRLVRGRTVLLAVLNEVAFWPQEGSASPDVETFRAIMPGMASLGEEAMLIMISSAHRRSGLLYSRWHRLFGADNPDTLVVHAKTRELNPTISQAIIDAAMADDPQSASAEFDSRWRDDLAGYLTRAEIEACIDRGVTVRAPLVGVRYEAYVDASSGSGRDSFTATVGHRGDGDRCIVDCIIEIKPPFSPPDAVARISDMLRSYNSITRVTGDRWGLGFVESEFRRHGIEMDYSDKTRSDVYRESLPVIRSGRARVLDHDRMVNQFVALERRVLPGGGERIDHPQRQGHHDDISNTVAGLLCLLSTDLRGAAGWLEYYRRLTEASFNRSGVDMDGARAAGPEFGWAFSAEPLVTINVPEHARGAYGSAFEIVRSQAKAFLCNSTWREVNPDLARELEVTP